MSEDSQNSLRDILGFDGDIYEEMIRSAAQCYSNGDFKMACSILNGLIQLDNSDSRAYKLLGSSLLLQKRNADAEVAYETAVRLDPSDPYTLVALAELKLKGLKLNEALPYLEQLFKLDPSGQHPAVNRGKTLAADYYEKLQG